LALGGAGVECRSQRAEIVMLIDALNVNALTVDMDAPLRIELHVADAESR
jgi:hypothetical protein